jgi:hypothetical protein
LIVPSSSASENQRGPRHQLTAWQSIFSAAG